MGAAHTQKSSINLFGLVRIGTKPLQSHTSVMTIQSDDIHLVTEVINGDVCQMSQRAPLKF